MLALISDIHSNLEALNAVFAEIDRRGITDVICLGDIIGYGPNPMECLDIVADRCRISLMGNHDFAVFYEPFNFNSGAEQACFWTRNCFETDPDPVRRSRKWKVLGNFPERLNQGQIIGGKTAPRRPIKKYIFTLIVYAIPGKIVATLW